MTNQNPSRQHPEPIQGETAERQTLWLLLLLAILLLAAVLRLTRLDLTEFKSDEAGIARAALALVHEGRFPVVGPSSSQGPAHPPLQIYLMALPFAITQDPRLAVAVVALIHTAAVLMAYLLGIRFFDRRVGLMAAFLFAVNPWAIYYARKIWTQNWPLATALFIFCLLLLVVERRSWALVGASLALVALTGTHLGGLAFIVVLLLVLLLFPSRLRQRPSRRHPEPLEGEPVEIELGEREPAGGVRNWPALIAALLFLLFAVPYLTYDATHDWQSLRGLFNPDAGPAQVDLEAARFATWLASGYHYQDLAGDRHAQFLAGLPDLRWLDAVEMILLGVGLAYLAGRTIRHALQGREHWRGSAARDVVLLSWLLVPVLLQTRHSQPVYPHYFILLYPAQHLVIALVLIDGLDWLRPRLDHRLRRWFTVGLVGLVVAIGAWQVYLEQSFVRFVARYDTPGGYGPVVGPLWRTASVAGETAAADRAEILVVAQGDNPIWDNLPAAFDVLLPRHLSHRFVDGQKALVFPQGPTVYITTPEVEEVAATLGQQTGAALVQQIDAPGEQTLRVFRRENASRDDVLQGMTSLEPPQRLANDVELLAYSVGRESQPGGTLRFTLAWWLDGPPPVDTNYHAFAHLVDTEGERFGQHDLSSFPSASWQTGDLVLTTFQIEIDAAAPAGAYWIRVGMYSYPDVVSAPVLDAAGNPAADAVVIGPISLP